ncbi:MAG: DUF1616 domain-containing protein [Candidatus Woesearchaeota archaeon]
MNILQIIQIPTGLILALFLPGYLIARIFFKELDELEKVALGFVLSIAIDIALGLFLGYNETMKNITGGITAFNLWLYLGSITIILIIFWIFKNDDEYRKVINLFKKLFEKETSHIEKTSPKIPNISLKKILHKKK